MMRFFADELGGGAPRAGQSSGSTGALGSVASQLGVPLGGGAAPQGSDTFPYVYLGTSKRTVSRRTGGDADYENRITTSTEKRGLLTDLIDDFQAGSKEEIHRMAVLLGIAGFGSGSDVEAGVKWAQNASLDEVIGAYFNLLEKSATEYGRGKKLTPEQILKRAIEYRLPNFNGDLDSLSDPDTLGARFGASLAGTRTSTYTSVDLMDPADAKALIRSVLQSELGRDPTQAEYEDFISTVQAAERQNPTRTTTRTTYDAEGQVVSQNSNTSGGINEAGLGNLVTDKVRESPSWAKWQAVGTYAPALFAALDSPVE